MIFLLVALPGFFLSWFPQDSAAMLAHLSHADAALHVRFCSGSSVTISLCEFGIVEMCLSQSEWAKRLRLVYP
jgi:hypothetical protein